MITTDPAVFLPDASDGALTNSLARPRTDFADRAHLALTLRRRDGNQNTVPGFPICIRIRPGFP